MTFDNSGMILLRERFADQFEPDGSSFLYRRYSKGAPIRVTAEERERFVRGYNRFLTMAMWATVVSTIVLIPVSVFLSIRLGLSVSGFPIWLGIGFVLAGFLLANYRAFNQPSKSLADRICEGAPRSKSEIRRIFLTKITYAQIASAVFAPAVVCIGMWLKQRASSEWGDLWLVAALLLILLATVQVFRKWRFESTQAQ